MDSTTNPLEATATATDNSTTDKIAEILKKLGVSDETIAKIKEEISKASSSTKSVSVEIEKKETLPTEQKEETDEEKNKRVSDTLLPGFKSV